MQITPILVCAIIFTALYKIIEIFVHKKERIILVDKLEKLDLSKENNLDFAKILGEGNKNWALRVGGLLLGIGSGVLIGYLIAQASGLYTGDFSRVDRQQLTVIYSSCTLLFGGMGLLVSFFAERKLKD